MFLIYFKYRVERFNYSNLETLLRILHEFVVVIERERERERVPKNVIVLFALIFLIKIFHTQFSNNVKFHQT